MGKHRIYTEQSQISKNNNDTHRIKLQCRIHPLSSDSLDRLYRQNYSQYKYKLKHNIKLNNKHILKRALAALDDEESNNILLLTTRPASSGTNQLMSMK